MKAIVTGAAGFIGSHLVDTLLKLGWDVIGIDNLSSGSIDNLSQATSNSNFRFIKADLLNPNEWKECLKGVDVVFHFAANPDVRDSTKKPLNHYNQNITATLYLLEASRSFNIQTFVFASSSTVYGDPEKIPTPETHPIKPISIYGATKAASEILIQTYSRLYGIKSLILRYANIIGPRQKRGVIYDFIVKLRKNPYRLEILGDGTQRKSYLYIDDAINATIKALKRIVNEENEGTIIYNVGNVDWINVKEIANIIMETMNISSKEIELVYYSPTLDKRGWLGDVKFMLLDISKIKRDTGWKPMLSSIKAIEETIEHLTKEI